jgi:hypothetical protein
MCHPSAGRLDLPKTETSSIITISYEFKAGSFVSRCPAHHPTFGTKKGKSLPFFGYYW